MTSAELYDPASGSWTATGSLNTARTFTHGDVAAQRQGAGGRGVTELGTLTSAELYDPASGSWTADRQPQHRTRFSHGDVAAQRQGAGGRGRSKAPLPARNCTIRRAGAGRPRAASTSRARFPRRRCCPTARCWWQGDLMAAAPILRARNCTTRRPGAGLPQAASTPHALFTRRRCCPTARCWWQGEKMAAILTSAELYDPASGSWTATGSLNTARSSHTATLLPNGKVLVAGGLDSSALLRARNCTIRRAGAGRPRAASTPRAFSHGDVAAQRQGAGRRGIDSNSGSFLASAELYDPASGNWRVTGSLNTARSSHTATLLPNGKVLVAGG